MSSLIDVAKKAGVSKTLVSRVINHQSGVSEESRQKIRAAMTELKYEPNAIARSLVRKRTYTLGVVMDTLCEPYFFPLVEAIGDEASKTNYDVVFSSGRNSSEAKKRAVRYYMQGRADGVIIYGSHLDDEALIRYLSETDYPFVVVENNLPLLNVNNIIVDNAYGSELAVAHLLECGCSTIYHVAGDQNVRAAVERKDGFVSAMLRRGKKVDDRMIIEANFLVEDSYRIMKAYLASSGRKNLPDAFYCGSDNTAYGVMMALEDEGIRIPEDVMIIGFDDDKVPEADRKLKKLTTLAQPMYQLGSTAVEVLIADIESSKEKKQKVTFYPELIRRETTVMK